MKVETGKGGEQAQGVFNPELLSLPELKSRLDANRAERASLRVKMEELQEEKDGASGVGGLDLVPLLREWVAKRREEERASFRAQLAGLTEQRGGGVVERSVGILADSTLRGKFDEMVAARVLMQNGERTNGLQPPLFAVLGDEFVRVWSELAVEKFGDRSKADLVRKRAAVDLELQKLHARAVAIDGENSQIADYIQSVLQ
jgi:hypothetical protein